tara:strand:- start:278 stop:415 length:138 start_codon:yes stop_codon:yes gene_type:complete
MSRINSGGSKTTITKRKRPGVHAKSKTSKLKRSINYKKKYKGQGK